MKSVFVILSLLFLGALGEVPVPRGTLGVVSPVGRCGGVGTFIELRISDCNGRCELVAGSPYNCEMDFMPSGAAPGLWLVVDICLKDMGFCWTVIETQIPNSSVQPGFVYTAKYTLVPNDVFAGETLVFKAHIIRTDERIEEMCVTAEVDMLAPSSMQ